MNENNDYLNKLKKERIGKTVKITDYLSAYNTLYELADKMKLSIYKEINKEDNNKTGIIINIDRHPYFNRIIIYYIALDDKDILIEGTGFEIID